MWKEMCQQEYVNGRREVEIDLIKYYFNKRGLESGN